MTGQLDRWERLLERQMAAAPYVLLVISMVLSLLIDGRSWLTVTLVAVAAAWIRLVPRGGLYVAGLVVLIGVLCTRGMWFASFFGFTGYLHSWQYLKGTWRFAGVTATAAISVAAYNGGLPDPTPSAIFTYLFFTAAIVAVVGVFSFVGEITTERSAERKRMVAQLEKAMRENAGLHAQLLVQAREAGVLDERQRMAAEIHDTLAQGLTGIITQLQAAQQAEDWRRHMDNAVRLARESLAEARRSVHAVGPGQLEAAPLPEALREVVARWSEFNGVRADFTTTGTVRPMHPEVEETLLRTAQEALANAAKHAGASRVGLTLSYMEDVVTLDVRDDGAGFDPERVRDGGGFGLTSMGKRVSRLAGTLEIESEPGGGTAVSASVPAVARG
ncbi:sensor histidine kinase [Streptosporangium roseum]|uniref:Oxygen sensor histidine kinase NreB n=1 Tax=Streptosporangium roseum (strain ATCC 12428 / DSM 43021 / JCM 3005 / KCTC 9067 / NCIMB 10171 / NRRL 2505 / NI 9100) TaxID=479432 RepID=D2AZC3_STRRD|nr:sensor histidine kinase [Streptosporangium roseum]ACZ83308.1 Histidine kinase [Streptosporangium roseum DSM 43021]